MTVNTTDITSGPYPGNDIADTFSYTFRIEDKTQLIVYETDDADVQTVLTVDTDYTVAGIGDDAGGTITRVAGALPTDYEWYIRSNYDETQLTAFASQGGFFPDVHEDAFDKLTFLIQQIEDVLSRSMRLSSGYTGGEIDSLPDPVAQQFLRWKSDLSGFENVALSTASVNLPVIQLSSHASLSDALSAIGSTEVELWIDTSDTNIDSPLISPENVAIKVVNGNILDGTSTLTVNGNLQAGTYQIFGSNITVSGVKSVFPEWWGNDTTAWQKAIDTLSDVEFSQGEYQTTGLKYYSFQKITFTNNSYLKMTAASGFVLRQSQSPLIEKPVDKVEHAKIIDPRIDMDNKGDAALLMECSWDSDIIRPKIENVPSGTFSYTDSGGVTNTFDKTGIILKSIDDGAGTTAGVYYNLIYHPHIEGNVGAYGQTGILFTDSSGGTQRANTNTVIKPRVKYCEKGVFLEYGGDNVLDAPELSLCTTAIDDDGVRNIYIKPYMEACTTGLDATDATGPTVIGLGSTSGTTTDYIEPTTQPERASFAFSGRRDFALEPVLSAGKIVGGSNLRNIVGSYSASGDNMTWYTYEDTATDWIARMRLNRATSPDLYSVLNLDAPGAQTKTTFLRPSRAGTSLNDVISRYTPSSTFRNNIAVTLGGSGGEYPVFCGEDSNSTYNWVPFGLVIRKSTTGALFILI